MNTSVLHAMAMESAENVLCGTKSGATEPTKQDREFLSEKQLEQGYRLACQSYPTEEYKVEIPELEETIEVLSQWENQRTEEILKKYSRRNGREKQKMHFMESASTSEQRLWRHCL